MNKKQEYERLTLSLSPKLNTQIRLEAVKAGITLSEMVEKYREVYLQELEHEKSKRRAEREGRRCKNCGQLIIN